MKYLEAFFVNVSLLVTVTYLGNLGFKYGFAGMSPGIRRWLLVAFFVIGGWLTMKYAVRINDQNLFDLRTVPFIFGTLLFDRSRYLVAIGIGIALARLSINGITPSAITGSINILLLGLTSASLVRLYRDRFLAFEKKAVVSVVTINTAQVLGILSFGAIPNEIYLTEVAPYTFPASLLLGGLFVFFVRDFYKEQLAAAKLRRLYASLRGKTKALRHSKREMEETAERLRQVSKYKSEFIANMSHEYKTPLNSIIGLSQLLEEDEELQEHARRFAAMIRDSGTGLLRVMEDVMEIARLEAGNAELNSEPFVLDDLLQAIASQYGPRAEAKGLSYRSTVAADVPGTIESDYAKIVRIVGHLLDNAVKFTDSGSVALSVQRQDGMIAFEVSDTGSGIAGDLQASVFEAFMQADGAFNRRHGGAGLGLTVCQLLTGRLGGSLSVRSRLGEGSTFVLKVPVSPYRIQAGEQGGISPTGDSV